MFRHNNQLTLQPKKASAVSFIFPKIMAEISSGLKQFELPGPVATSTKILPPFSVTMKGSKDLSFWTVASKNFLPMSRFASYTVDLGFVEAFPPDFLKTNHN